MLREITLLDPLTCGCIMSSLASSVISEYLLSFSPRPRSLSSKEKVILIRESSPKLLHLAVHPRQVKPPPMSASKSSPSLTRPSLDRRNNLQLPRQLLHLQTHNMPLSLMAPLPPSTRQRRMCSQSRKTKGPGRKLNPTVPFALQHRFPLSHARKAPQTPRRP